MGNIEGLIEGQKHLMVIGKMMGVHHQVAHRQLLAGIALRASYPLFPHFAAKLSSPCESSFEYCT